MCDTNAKYKSLHDDDIEQIMVTWMRGERSFTSVDIANDLKNKGFWARNREIAQWLRLNAIAVAHRYGFLYNQTLIRVQSKREGMTLAYLYHEMNTDPDDYLDRDQEPMSAIPTKSISPSVNILRKGKDSWDVVVSGKQPTRKRHWQSQPRDSRGRWV